MKIEFFDTKPYDKEAFDKAIGQYAIAIKYFETKLNEDTVFLAKGADSACVFCQRYDKLRCHRFIEQPRNQHPPAEMRRL